MKIKYRFSWIALALLIFDVCLFAGIFLYIFVLNPDHEIRKTKYNYELRDVTYEEMRLFLDKDKTDSNKFRITPFVFFNYDCSNFAKDLKRNAIRRGIRCAGVVIKSKGGNWQHALVAFNTTDKGIVFIDPQLDIEVEVAVGAEYYSGEIIEECLIYWPIGQTTKSHTN